MLSEKTICRRSKLRTGTIIIGYFSCVISFSVFLYFICSVIPDNVNNETKFGLVFWVFYTFMLTVTSAFLIIGATERRKWFLLPWIAIVFTFTLQTIAGTGSFIYDFSKGAILLSTTEGLLIIFSVFVSLALYIYFLTIVVCYFLELWNNKKETKSEEAGENVPLKQPIQNSATSQ